MKREPQVQKNRKNGKTCGIKDISCNLRKATERTVFWFLEY